MQNERMDLETVALPDSVYDIDLDWFRAALDAAGHDVEVTSIERLDVVHATCTKARFKLTYKQETSLPKRMILKGAFEDHSERMAFMYQNEARFYGQIAPLLPIRCPKSYWAGIDPGGWRAAELLEDLTLRDVTFCRAQDPFGFDHVRQRLDQLAALHAQTWESDRFAEGGTWAWINSRFDEDSMGYARYYLEAERWQKYMEKPRGVAVSTRLQDRDWMESALMRLAELEASGPVCLIHGDTHPGNLYLEADGTPCFLDPALSRTAWWMEVTYHIIASLDIADRRNWDRALLAHYLDRLAQEGGPVVQFDEAWLRFRQAAAYGLFIFLINETTFQTEATNTCYAARFGTAAIELDTIGALA